MGVAATARKKLGGALRLGGPRSGAAELRAEPRGGQHQAPPRWGAAVGCGPDPGTANIGGALLVACER